MTGAPVGNHRLMLPTPEAHGLPDDATIAVPVPAAGLTLFRLLESETPRLKDFEPAMTRAQAQLRGIPELSRVSISHWVELGQAIGASERRVCLVARVDLVADLVTRVALTEGDGEGHVDVWASPHILLRSVAEVSRHRTRT